MLVHRRSLPRNLLGLPNNSPVPIHTPGRREPKNTTHCPRPGLEPWPLAPESSAVTMSRPPCLPAWQIRRLLLVQVIILMITKWKKFAWRKCQRILLEAIFSHSRNSCTGSQEPIQKTKQYTTANQWLLNKERTMVIPLHVKRYTSFRTKFSWSIYGISLTKKISHFLPANHNPELRSVICSGATFLHWCYTWTAVPYSHKPIRIE